MAEFNWNHLQAFLAVARSGRLTGAATRLSSDHTTVSRRITSLEGALDAKLFERASTGYTLTAEGTKLLPIAEQMEALALGARDLVGGAAAAVSGTVRIGAPEGFGSYFLAPRIARLADTHPELRLQMVAGPNLYSLARRDADVIVTLSRPAEGRLYAQKLTDYRLGLYAARSYLDAHPPIAAIGDLKAHRFIGYIGELLHAPELDYLRQLDPDIAPAIESSNLVAQLRATLAGAGLCVIPDFIARGDPRIAAVLPDAVVLTRSFWMVAHADLKDLARVRTAMRFIAAEVAKEEAAFLGPSIRALDKLGPDSG